MPCKWLLLSFDRLFFWWSLESVYTGNCIWGSNPHLSARKNAENTSAFFVYAISQHTELCCMKYGGALFIYTETPSQPESTVERVLNIMLLPSITFY